ncbi:9555_t:CDS:2, partial [Racocetra persica]
MVLDYDSDLLSKQTALMSCGLNTEVKRKRNDEFKREIIIISESNSDDELPEVETLLLNIFKKQKLLDKKTEKKPVTKNDEFIFITNDKNKIIIENTLILLEIDRNNFISEVIISEMSVQLIMEDLNVDYELGIEIRKFSSEYGSVHFISNEDLSYSSVEINAFMDKVTKELMDDP